MFNIQDLQDEFPRELSLLTELVSFSKGYGNEIHIAGGYLRDSIYGKEVKDIDVYLSNIDSSMRQSFAKWFNLEPKSNGSGSEESGFDVWYSKHAPKLDIIFIDTTMEEFIEKDFDSSICEIWFNCKTGVLRKTELFDSTRKTNYIVYKGDRLQADNSIHLKNILNKYPEMGVSYNAVQVTKFRSVPS